MFRNEENIISFWEASTINFKAEDNCKFAAEVT